MSNELEKPNVKALKEELSKLYDDFHRLANRHKR